MQDSLSQVEIISVQVVAKYCTQWVTTPTSPTEHLSKDFDKKIAYQEDLSKTFWQKAQYPLQNPHFVGQDHGDAQQKSRIFSQKRTCHKSQRCTAFRSKSQKEFATDAIIPPRACLVCRLNLKRLFDLPNTHWTWEAILEVAVDCLFYCHHGTSVGVDNETWGFIL